MKNKKEIKINQIEKKYQIADCLTKYGASSEKLLNTLKKNQLNFYITKNENNNTRFKLITSF